MTGALLGSLIEAWQELRIHKLRVLLSLVGVAVAVASLTMVVAMSTLVQDNFRVNYEQMGGRDATLELQPAGGELGADPRAMRAAVDPVLEEFGIGHSSVSGYVDAVMDSEMGEQFVSASLVEHDWQTMHSVGLVAGRWFSPGEEQNLAPSAVVNENMLEWSGRTRADLPFSLSLGPASGGDPVAVTVVGVTPGNDYDSGEAFMLAGSPSTTQLAGPELGLTMQAWVPSEISEELSTQLSSRLTKATGESWEVWRVDLFQEGGDPLATLRLALLGIAGLILFLGVLGLVNIALVTVQQRVREIGIRRSFGATGARVFFSVLMESVVATSIAGVVGIAVSVLALRSPQVLSFVSEGMNVTPSFPFSAAVVGFLVAVLSGAVAGFVPALIATRARIVDAIRA
ncbi:MULTISPECIES: ABC transporter permease [Brevibacterium]|uniref:ABC transporter permease n=1 Tax=Brevibacterium salitolerans TaxID=1403566 RepID=A0ABN2WKJ8_9MICO|nr:ABC transporter permease [Brevibacterium sp.]